MTHTILIHQAFASKDDPGGTRHFELGRRLVADGQQITIVASDCNYSTGKRVVARTRLMTESNEDGIRVLRAYTYPEAHKGYLHRVISFLSFMATSFGVGVAAGKPDVVMGTTPPIFQAVSAWLLSVVRQRPFLLEVRDLWPEFAIDIGLLKSPILICVARWLENFLYSRADHLLVNSPAYREYLIGKGIKAEKISFIANGVDPEMFDPHERAEDFRQEFGLQDKFVITYAGAIGMANDIDMLVEAAAAIKDREDIQILVVGDGMERVRLEKRVRELGLKNLTFTGPFPKSQMEHVLAASDACVAILRNIKMFATTYPNKVFDYMAAGRPTILAIDGVIRRVVEDADGGVFVQPGDGKMLAKAMIDLAEHPKRSREMGLRAHAYVVEHFNRDEQARELTALLLRLASGELSL